MKAESESGLKRDSSWSADDDKEHDAFPHGMALIHALLIHALSHDHPFAFLCLCMCVCCRGSAAQVPLLQPSTSSSRCTSSPHLIHPLYPLPTHLSHSLCKAPQASRGKKGVWGAYPS